jgi:hypothetical protein
MTGEEKDYLADLLLQHPAWPVVLEQVKREIRHSRDAFLGAHPGDGSFSERALSFHATQNVLHDLVRGLYREGGVDVPKDLKALFEMNA